MDPAVRVAHPSLSPTPHPHPPPVRSVLAPRGHGKSSLLRLLSGRLADDAVVGRVTTNGRTHAEMRADGLHPPRLARYVDQTDSHIPELTVRQALLFEQRTQTVANTAPGGDDAAVAAVADAVGLTRCLDTPIGDTLTRGISGGERRRVALAEALLSDARVLCLDEATSGLDSARAADVARYATAWARAKKGVLVAALLQPGPDVVHAFDDVILLRHGRVLFHGPHPALQTWMAVHLSHVSLSTRLEGGGGVDVAGVLVDALGDEEGGLARLPAHVSRAPGVPPPPRLPLSPALRAVYGARFPRGYAVTLGSVLRRDAILLRRTVSGVAGRVASTLIIAAVVASGFVSLPLYDAGAKLGLMMFLLAHIATVTFQDIPRVVQGRDTAAVQVGHGMMPPSAAVLSGLLLSLPVATCETLIYAAIVYFAPGLDPAPARFLLFASLLLVLSVAMSSLFRAFGYGAATSDGAQLSLGIVLTVLELSAGYLLSPAKLGMWAWMHHSLPYGYVMRALAWNEFTAPRYGEAVATAGGQAYGATLLQLYGLDVSGDIVWAAFLYLLAMTVATTSASAVFLARRAAPSAVARPPPPPPAVVTAGQAAQGVLNAAHSGATASGSSEESGTTWAAHGKGSAEPKPHALPPLSVPPVTLSFADVTYSVQVPGERARWRRSTATSRCLLQGIHDVAQPGRMLALMGGSGAGKTTLLDVIAGRKNSGAIAGSISINGQPVLPSHMRAVAAYCEQVDVHEPWSTVREALTFSAHLRLPAGTPRTSVAAIVEGVLDELDLRVEAETRVGAGGGAGGGSASSAAQCLSLSARKRLSIGVEVVACQPVLFLDEPTTGLDSTTAATVIACLRRIADTGRTVIATIHQPSDAIFSAFDDLILLAPGGFHAYAGPREGVLPHLRSVRHDAVHAPAWTDGVTSPATWMMQVTCGRAAVDGPPSTTEGSSSGTSEAAVPLDTPLAAVAVGDSRVVVGEALQATYKASPAFAELLRHAAAASSSGKVVPSARVLPGGLAQTLALLVRHLHMHVRNKDYVTGRLGSMLFISLLLGLIYLRLDSGGLAGLQSLVGLLITAATMLATLPAQTYLAVAMEARPVVEREAAAGLYSWAAHCTSSTLSELASIAVLAPPVLALLYYMVGLAGSGVGPGSPVSDGGAAFGHFVATVLALSAWFLSFVQVGVMALGSMEDTLTVLLLILMLANLYSGLVSLRARGVGVRRSDAHARLLSACMRLGLNIT